MTALLFLIGVGSILFNFLLLIPLGIPFIL
jgi:hypothetical protein